MSVKILSVGIKPELSADSKDFLIGNITNKMVATIVAVADPVAKAGATADGEDMVFSATDNSVTWNGGNFEDEDFFDGDTVNIAGSASNNGNKTIDTVEGNKLYFTTAIVTETAESAVIRATKECKGINFRYNLIENDAAADYNSLVDGNELRFSHAALDYTSFIDKTLNQQGVYKSNNQGSVVARGYEVQPATGDMTFTAADKSIVWTGNFETEGFYEGATITITGTAGNNGTKTIRSVNGNKIITYESLTDEAVVGTADIQAPPQRNRFIIQHTFYVTPLFLLEQLADFENDIAPEYFFDQACLKYLFNIELMHQLSDPNRVYKSEDESMLGNSGWFNENFNGGLPKFEIDDIVFTVNGDQVEYADYNEVTDVEITVSSADGVFSNGNTKFVLSHFILPEEESQYKNTTTDLEENFMFDRKLQTLGSAPVNGDKYGTAKQVLKSIQAVYSSASIMVIKAKIDLSSAYKARIEDLESRKFILAVTVQDHAKSTDLSDCVTLRKGIQTYDTDLSNDRVGEINTVFNYLPDVSINAGSAGMFVEDLLRSKNILRVNISGSPTIKQMSVVLLARKGSQTFEMERSDFSFAGTVVQSGVQQINIEEKRGFIVGSTNPFNDMSLKRRSDLDSGNNRFYELIYPFKIRWEYFIQLAGVDAEFYDITEDFDGFNHNWNRYFVGSGWGLIHRVEAIIEENGFENTVSCETDMFAYDYQDGNDWTVDIKIYDIDTATEIPNNVLSDKTVQVKAIFTKVSGGIPDLADVEGIIEVEPHEAGGVNTIRNINTMYEHESNSPFISVLSNKLLKKEKASNVYTFTANIDGKLLTGDPKISARIYDLTQPPFGGLKEFQDGNDFHFQDGVGYEFQDS